MNVSCPGLTSAFSRHAVKSCALSLLYDASSRVIPVELICNRFLATSSLTASFRASLYHQQQQQQQQHEHDFRRGKLECLNAMSRLCYEHDVCLSVCLSVCNGGGLWSQRHSATKTGNRHMTGFVGVDLHAKADPYRRILWSGYGKIWSLGSSAAVQRLACRTISVHAKLLVRSPAGQIMLFTRVQYKTSLTMQGMFSNCKMIDAFYRHQLSNTQAFSTCYEKYQYQSKLNLN